MVLHKRTFFLHPQLGKPQNPGGSLCFLGSGWFVYKRTKGRWPFYPPRKMSGRWGLGLASETEARLLERLTGSANSSQPSLPR